MTYQDILTLEKTALDSPLSAFNFVSIPEDQNCLKTKPVGHWGVMKLATKKLDSTLTK